MSAVTRPGYAPPPGAPPRRRRWWLYGIVAAWIVVVAVLAVWSVGNEPATVPEQRDIGRAVPDLQRATGVVYAAASGPGRAVVLDELAFVEDCRVTPLRSGLVATREMTLHVGAGKATEALDDVVAALPADYRAEVAESRGGTRLSLFADAGDFIAVEATAEATSQVLNLRLSTGCRPRSGSPNRADPSAAPPPPLLGRVLTALAGASAGGDPSPAVRAVACPGGGVAASYVVAGVPGPRDLAAALRAVSEDAEVVRADAATRAYRVGDESVVVTPEGGRLRVSVSTPC